MKRVPVVIYKDGQRQKVGTAIVETNVEGLIVVTASVDSGYAKRFEDQCKMVSLGPSIKSDDLRKPCKGRDSNVCVAEGCYNEACLRLKKK